LPNDVRASAYDYVDRQSRAKKLYVEAHEYWRLLFELDIKGAQDNFAARFAHSLPDRETLQELIKLAVPSERITKAITEWRRLAKREGTYEYYTEEFRQLELKLDPNGRLRPF